jgi:AcrR family transcriptional regulator
MSMYSERQTGTVEVAWEPTPLPRGRHGLGPDEVRASQQARIVRAMLESVAEHGYAGTTVQRVAAAARVSPNAFYKFFDDKLDCFLAVIDADAEQLVTELTEQADPSDWRATLRRGLRHYLEWWPARPLLSRAFLLELPAAGGRAVEHRDRIHDRFVDMQLALATLARRQEPDLPPVSPASVRLFLHGLTELVAHEVRAGRLDQLPALEHDVVRLAETALAA